MHALFQIRQRRWAIAAAARFLSIIVLSLVVIGCATRPFQGADIDASDFLQRSISQDQGSIRVTAAVPDASETEALIGLDLYKQGIQPVWLKVENNGTGWARIATWSVDRDYFSPIEVA
jgi:hypothetical protein